MQENVNKMQTDLFLFLKCAQFISVLDEECSEIELGQVTLPAARCQAGLMCIGGRCVEYSNVIEVTELIIV